MTIIAAIATDDQVFMACDTRTDYSGTGMYSAAGKIGTLLTPKGEKVLLGAAGNASILPAILRAVTVADTPDPEKWEDVDVWADTMADAITGALSDANPSLVGPPSDDGAAIAGVVVMAWRQHLWWVYTHAASRPEGGVLAIGSGTEVALGSLHTAVEFGADPSKAVDMAVRLACRHASGCGIDDRGPLLRATVD